MEKGTLFNRGSLPPMHLWPCRLRDEVNKAIWDMILSKRDRRLIERYNSLTWKQRMTHKEAISKIAEEEKRSPGLIEKTIKRAQSMTEAFLRLS